jgi:1,4-alpha-glucan branching enzyme
VADLNRVYRRSPALWERDDEPQGFAWIDCNDHEQSVVSLMRRGADEARPLVAVVNFTPIPRRGYRIGVPLGGGYVERLNSDADVYGGSGMGNDGRIAADDIPAHGHPHSLNLLVPPLGFLLLEPENDG